MATVTWPTLLWKTNLACLGDYWGSGLDASPALSLDGSTVYIASTSNLLYSLYCSLDTSGAGHYPAPMNTVASLFNGNHLNIPWYYIVPSVTNGTTFANWTGDRFVTDTNNATIAAAGHGSAAWLPNGDVTMLPGMGVMAVLTTNWTTSSVWFIGLVREEVTNQIHMGSNYLGSALPIEGGISSALGFTNVSTNLDYLWKWNPTNQQWSETYTNYGGAGWGTNEPIIGIAEGFVLFSSTNQTWVQTFSPCPGN